MPLVGTVVHSISKKYYFESAHFLPLVPEGHRCKRLHGHGYTIEVTLAGTVGNDGLILDFWELDKLVEPIIAEVDHRCLNDIKGLENPTAELISAWLWDRIESELAYGGGDTEFDVTEIRVWETPTSCAILKRGEEQ